MSRSPIRYARPAFSGFTATDRFISVKNAPVDSSKIVGLTVETDITFDASLGQVHDVLSSFLGMDKPSLRASVGFGGFSGWHSPLSASSFQLNGVFLDAAPKSPCNKIAWTKIGAKLTGSNQVSFGQDGQVVREKTFGYGLFGGLHVTVPWSQLPLEMEFDIEPMGDLAKLSATADKPLDHAFGISNLTVSSSTTQLLRLTSLIACTHPVAR